MRERYGDEYGMGWTISFARHHCHAGKRFKTVLICGDCNVADGVAKRKLKLPADWSFTAEEIGSFVWVDDHCGRTYIDYDKAQQIYDNALQC